MKLELKSSAKDFAIQHKLSLKRFKLLILLFGKHFFQYSLYIQDINIEQSCIEKLLQNIELYQDWNKHYFYKVLDNEVGVLLLENTIKYSFLVPGLFYLIKRVKEYNTLDSLINDIENIITS